MKLAGELSLLEQDAPGLIATNDWLAMGLRSGLRARTKSWMRAVPLVSFDGLPAARDPASGIQSLAVPIETIARDAIAEIARLRASKAPGRVIIYPLDWPEAL